MCIEKRLNCSVYAQSQQLVCKLTHYTDPMKTLPSVLLQVP